MDLTQLAYSPSSRQCVNAVSVVQLAMVQEDMEDESQTKQNLLYVLSLRQCAWTEILLTDWHEKIRIKGIFKTQLFQHKQTHSNNILLSEYFYLFECFSDDREFANGSVCVECDNQCEKAEDKTLSCHGPVSKPTSV